MGLDMSLVKKIYVKNWYHMEPEERHEITVTKGGKPTHIKPERVMYIIEELAAWRKANQIHQWFVEHVQDGNDDCKDYYVSHEQLTKLRDLCREVLEASKLVPGKITNGYRFKEGNPEPVPIIEDGMVIKDPRTA